MPSSPTTPETVQTEQGPSKTDYGTNRPSTNETPSESQPLSPASKTENRSTML